eukprot:scaffold5807_cov412-Prasinococcus_capsulatus_cf.AAC.1
MGPVCEKSCSAAPRPPIFFEIENCPSPLPVETHAGRVTSVSSLAAYSKRVRVRSFNRAFNDEEECRLSLQVVFRGQPTWRRSTSRFTKAGIFSRGSATV